MIYLRKSNKNWFCSTFLHVFFKKNRESDQNCKDITFYRVIRYEMSGSGSFLSTHSTSTICFNSTFIVSLYFLCQLLNVEKKILFFVVTNKQKHIFFHLRLCKKTCRFQCHSQETLLLSLTKKTPEFLIVRSTLFTFFWLNKLLVCRSEVQNRSTNKRKIEANIKEMHFYLFSECHLTN